MRVGDHGTVRGHNVSLSLSRGWRQLERGPIDVVHSFGHPGLCRIRFQVEEGVGSASALPYSSLRSVNCSRSTQVVGNGLVWQN
jgi:hypothetical protein